MFNNLKKIIVLKDTIKDLENQKNTVIIQNKGLENQVEEQRRQIKILEEELDIHINKEKMREIEVRLSIFTNLVAVAGSATTTDILNTFTNWVLGKE